MVLQIMCWQTKEIYQIILEFTSRKIRWDNHVELTVSVSLKSRETPTGKPLLHKGESIVGSAYVIKGHLLVC